MIMEKEMMFMALTTTNKHYENTYVAVEEHPVECTPEFIEYISGQPDVIVFGSKKTAQVSKWMAYDDPHHGRVFLAPGYYRLNIGNMIPSWSQTSEGVDSNE
nr:putative ORF1 [Marmot picobirnavirus]